MTTNEVEITESEMESFKSHNYSLTWLYDMFTLSQSIEALAQKWGTKPSFYRNVFDNCGYESHYGVFVTFNNGEVYNIVDICDLWEF
jgi:hypothetical protein